MTEHTARPRRHGDKIERLQASRIHRGWQLEFEDQLAGARPSPDLAETDTVVHDARPAVVRRDQQPHATTARDAPEPLHHFLDGSFAVAAALLPLIERQPAKPPAGDIA